MKEETLSRPSQACCFPFTRVANLPESWKYEMRGLRINFFFSVLSKLIVFTWHTYNLGVQPGLLSSVLEDAWVGLYQNKSLMDFVMTAKKAFNSKEPHIPNQNHAQQTAELPHKLKMTSGHFCFWFNTNTVTSLKHLMIVTWAGIRNYFDIFISHLF